MKITNIDSAGLSLIKQFEGFKSKPYLCPAGAPTIGYGTTRYPNGQKVSLSDNSVSEAEAEAFLKHDVRQFELAVDAMATDVLTQNQFNALVSFAYNLGAANLKSSTLLKKVNANSWDTSISNEFSKWVNANGKKLPGLVTRRKAEADMYFKTNSL
jgi:lysozyme